MWRILLSFAAHRTVLLGVALIAANSSIQSRNHEPGSHWRLEPTTVLLQHLETRVQGAAEIDLMKRLAPLPIGQVVSENRHPFYWVVRIALGLFPLSVTMTTLLVSNLFFIFFLFETFVLLGRMVILETALWGTLLVMVFPSSYEMSLGSSLPFSLCMVAVMLRRALDNQWFIAGIAILLLALGDWVILGWLPLLAGIFWYYQRHFQLGQVVKRACFLGIPLAVGIFLRWDWYVHAAGSIPGSALASLVFSPNQWVSGIGSGGLGGIISLVIFLVGATLSLASHTTWFNRMIPIYAIIAVLAFSSIATVPSRLLFAGMALAGIAHVSSGVLAKIMASILTGLTATEVYRVFSAA